MTQKPEGSKSTRKPDTWSQKPWKERAQAVKKNVQEALDNNDMEMLADCLPPLQKAFAEEYIKDFNGSQAVQRCGSTAQYPEKMAYLWMHNPGVKAYIKHLTEERTHRMKIDQGFVVQKLLASITRSEDKENEATVLRALELLARHLGMLTDKQEITGKDGGAIQMEKINEDADAFTRAIAGLVKRGGESRVADETQH